MDIFYPLAGIVFSKEGVFQQPRDLTPTECTDRRFSRGQGLVNLLSDVAFLVASISGLDY